MYSVNGEHLQTLSIIMFVYIVFSYDMYSLRLPDYDMVDLSLLLKIRQNRRPKPPWDSYLPVIKAERTGLHGNNIYYSVATADILCDRLDIHAIIACS